MRVRYIEKERERGRYREKREREYVRENVIRGRVHFNEAF